MRSSSVPTAQRNDYFGPFDPNVSNLSQTVTLFNCRTRQGSHADAHRLRSTRDVSRLHVLHLLDTSMRHSSTVPVVRQRPVRSCCRTFWAISILPEILDKA